MNTGPDPFDRLTAIALVSIPLEIAIQQTMEEEGGAERAQPTIDMQAAAFAEVSAAMGTNQDFKLVAAAVMTRRKDFEEKFLMGRPLSFSIPALRIAMGRVFDRHVMVTGEAGKALVAEAFAFCDDRLGAEKTEATGRLADFMERWFVANMVEGKCVTH